MGTKSSYIKSSPDLTSPPLRASRTLSFAPPPPYPVYYPRRINLCAHAEDMFKSLNYHGQDLTFGDLEIQKQSAVEKCEGGVEPELDVRRSTINLMCG